MNFKTFFVLILIVSLFSCKKEITKVNEIRQYKDMKIISYVLNSRKQELKFYWRNTDNSNYGSFNNLKLSLERNNKTLVFAMNGGMYDKDGSPQGLYIENSINYSKIDTTKKCYGNFYLQPNGVFYLSKNGIPGICTTNSFKENRDIKYATQSGPMLLIDGNINSKFNKESINKHIRNGVGILSNGNLLFAMSKEKINFYDFASYFKQKGCKNALYLDGFVSKTYLPIKNWEQLDGDFGVIIAETISK